MQDICVAPAGGGGEVHLLYESAIWKTTGSWMPDGKRLVFNAQHPTTDQDIMMLPAAGGEPAPILLTPFMEVWPQVSPDGRHLAYGSNESGRFEVYLRNLEGPAQKWQVSDQGGVEPRWRADGGELYYAAADGWVMAVPVPGGGTGRPGAPERLFELPERPDRFVSIFEDVTPDGRRFLLNVPTASLTSIGFHAVHGWTGLLAAGAPD